MNHSRNKILRITLCLQAGMKPKQIAEVVGCSLQAVNYANRKLADTEFWFLEVQAQLAKES